MATPEKKLFLLDAYALIYRAHFAFSKNPRINSKGMNTGCVLGFMNTLLEVINKEKPTHLAIAFDTPEPTFRHKEFEAYKAQRQEQPEDITHSIPYIKNLIEAFDIPILEKPGYEADDVIGTIAKQAAQKGFEVYMMTSDKDYSQLVDKNVYLYKPNFMGKGVEILDVPKVLEKWDIKRIDQVTDILGLQGDAVDNIPGIPGIGAKTAVKLLQEFDTVENLIKNAAQLKGKQRENVEQFGEQGILSKKLATINTEVPVEWSEEALKMGDPDKEKVTAIFDELEFRTLANRLFGEGTDASPAPAKKKASKQPDKDQMSLFDAPAPATDTEAADPFTPVTKDTIATTIHDYHLMDTPELRAALINYLEQQKEFCFDTETTGLDPIDAELVGIAFCYHPGEAYYVPVPEDQKATQKIVEEFRPLFENTSVLKIGQNLKYDIQVLKKYHIEVSGPLFDTLLAHYLIDPETRHNMDVLAENYLNYTPVPIESLIGKKGSSQGTMRDVDVKEVAEYAGEDADITFRLKQVFEKALQQDVLMKLFNEVEVPLVHVLADMEYEGVKVDTGVLEKMSGELQELSANAQEDVFRLAGQEFNIASPKQLGEVLFEKMKLADKPKKTKTGQYATGEDILSRLAHEHEIAGKILEFREYQKLKSTYVDALPRMVSPVTGRVHTDYRQAVAATGRLSSNNPNLQNIPIRTEKGREIRKAFVPRDKDHILLAADYSQIELRIMAAFSQDESMIEAFRNGRDIHATTASKVFNVPLEEMTPDIRRKAKEVNFGIIYGISPFGLAQNLGISRTEAKDIIDAYFKEFPKVKTYMDNAIEQAHEREYVETVLGRRRYLRDINSRNVTLRSFAERNAINAPIQGSAADMIKVAMINIHRWMKEKGLQSKMIMQVHDELIFDVHRSELETLQENVTEFMKTAIELDVPMEIGIGTGENWLEAH